MLLKELINLFIRGRQPQTNTIGSHITIKESLLPVNANSYYDIEYLLSLSEQLQTPTLEKSDTGTTKKA